MNWTAFYDTYYEDINFLYLFDLVASVSSASNEKFEQKVLRGSEI